MVTMKRLFLMILIVFTFASPVWPATYYIDYAGGSDANNGTAKETPWKLAPGMQGCLITDENNNNCRARTHATTTGDTFVFKGGVTWPASTLSFDWYFGNTTTFTVDATWYTGEAWSRPIFDAENGVPTASPEGIKAMMRSYGTGHTVNNIEFKGLAQLDDVGTPTMLQFGTSSDAHAEISNCYFHGWSHGGTATGDSMIILLSDFFDSPDLDTKIHHNVIDGADTTKDMAMAYKGSAGHFYNNYVANMRNGAVAKCLYVWGNTFYNIDISFDAGSHGNVYESGGQQTIFYNNYTNIATGGATLFNGPIDGSIDYVFNNVIIADSNPPIQIDNNTLSTGTGAGIYVFNNTIQEPAGNAQVCVNGPSRDGYPELPFMTVRNNHCIATNNTVNFGTKVTTETESNNLGQTNAEATAANYVSTGTYPYTPPAGGGTINTGTAIDCAGIGLTDVTPSLALTACGYDTTLGVDYNATSHTVTYPKRTAIIRATRDIGAYEDGGVGTGTHNGISISGGVSFR
jgi:hypothetical protein